VDLLDEQYNPNQLLIRAAAEDKTTTVLTGYALTRGLYLAGTGYSLSNQQIQRAIPPSNATNYTDFQRELRDSALPHRLASVPVLEYGGGPDYRLSARRFCPQRKVLQDAYLNNNKKLRDKQKSLDDQYKATIYQELKKAFGTEVKNMEQALALRDYIISARHLAQKLNISISPKGLQQLDEMYAFVNYEEYYAEYQVAQLTSHGLLSEIKAHVKANLATSDRNLRRALVSYITDDLGILAFLRLVAGKDEDLRSLSDEFRLVPFASSLILEMYHEQDDKRASADSYNFRLTYNGKQVWWYNQEKELSLDDFFEWEDENMLSDFELVCKGLVIDEGSDTPWIVLGLIMTIILCIMVVIACIYILKKEPNETEGTRDSVEELKVDA
jgi:hypothetical protein